MNFYLSMLSIHLLWKVLANSRIHLLPTHLDPTTTGQPPCNLEKRGGIEKIN